jgi:anaerobic selenocysteine-containing dehydrogenase
LSGGLNDQGREAPIGWDDAFGIVAGQLNGLASPDEATCYTSGRLNNEAALLLQLFARAYGTSNLPDCSNMCHASSGSGPGETLGIGKGSVSPDDIHESDLVFVGRGTEIAGQFLKIRPGGDLALFQMLNRLLLEAEDATPRHGLRPRLHRHSHDRVRRPRRPPAHDHLGARA